MLSAPDVTQVLEAFWRGSLGTSSALISGTLVRAVPLMLVGVGTAIAFRAGVFNIGGEGQLLMGGVAATVVGLQWAHALGPGAVVASLIAGAVAGAAWAGIAGILRSRFGVLEVITTIMLNFVAANLVSYAVRGPLQEPTHIYPQTETIAPNARLPLLMSETRLHVGIIVALVIAVSAWWMMTRTAVGFRMRAVGTSPTAARSSGRVDVAAVSMTALMLSGALAGLAGGIEVTGVTYALYENLSPGYGFSAIAVAILARLNPVAVIATAVFFATLETGALGMQRDAGVPSVVATALEAVVILVVIGIAGGSWERVARTRDVAAAHD
ncbi:MAG TPA: ABC transporter permease [Gemmatimonadaceae bacterium]|nr:ABC transporter permease [Gemmatimonadaceae bacterium]